jgi:two-component system LytT family response regulator
MNTGSRNTKKIRTLIVDDERIAREGIRMHLAGEQDVEIIGECANGLEAVSSIQEKLPDLVFLDVQMPGLDGFSVIEAVGLDALPAVIFVTAYDKYALRAFDIHALDYLLKPFDRERFLTALARARVHIERAAEDGLNSRLLSLLADLKAGQEGLLESSNIRPKYLERLVIKSAGHISFIGVEEIDWIEAADNYVELHAGRDAHLVRETMNALEAKLNPARFLRIRRSTIINIERIKELRPLFKGEYSVILKSGKELISSRRYRKNLSRLLDE